jgi:hypothetical protein
MYAVADDGTPPLEMLCNSMPYSMSGAHLLAVASLVLFAGLVSKGDGDIVVAEGGSAGGAVQAEEGGSNKTLSLDGIRRDLDGLVEVVQLVGLF